MRHREKRACAYKRDVPSLKYPHCNPAKTFRADEAVSHNSQSVPKAFPDTSAPTPPEPYIDEGDDSVHVTLYSIAVLSLCALLVGVIAAAATHVVMKQKSVQMLERSKAPWQSYGSRDEEGAPLIAKRPTSERGEREKRFYRDGKCERRRTAF